MVICGGLIGSIYVLLGDHKVTFVWTSYFLLNKWLFFHMCNNTLTSLFSHCSPKEVSVSPIVCCCCGEVIFLDEFHLLYSLFHGRHAVNAQKGSSLSQDQQLKLQRDQKWHHYVVSLMILEQNKLFSVILSLSKNDLSSSFCFPFSLRSLHGINDSSQDLFSSLFLVHYEYI